jgi:hypothetical protein
MFENRYEEQISVTQRSANLLTTVCPVLPKSCPEAQIRQHGSLKSQPFTMGRQMRLVLSTVLELRISFYKNRLDLVK